MKNAIFFFLFAAICRPDVLSACGGCMPFGVREATITELASYQHIFSGKVIDIEIIKKPEYEEKAKDAAHHVHGYGVGTVEIPSFETKLTIQLKNSYKGNQTATTITLLVKPTFDNDYCNYFKYKKNESYIFFLDDLAETHYYALVYLLDPKDYNKENLGWNDKEAAAKIHKHLLKNLDAIAATGKTEVQKFYNLDGTPFAEGSLVNGSMEGKWTSFQTGDGTTFKKHEEGTYKNGLKVGTWKMYHYLTEEVSQRTVYEQTDRDGKILVYFGDFLQSEQLFKNGKPEGRHVYYHNESKQAAYIYNYSNGLLDGDVEYYDTAGNLTSKQTYKNGEFVKV